MKGSHERLKWRAMLPSASTAPITSRFRVSLLSASASSSASAPAPPHRNTRRSTSCLSATPLPSNDSVLVRNPRAHARPWVTLGGGGWLRTVALYGGSDLLDELTGLLA